MCPGLASAVVAAAEESRPDPGDRPLRAGGPAWRTGRREPYRYSARLAHAPGPRRAAAATPEPAQPALDQAQPVVRGGAAACTARACSPCPASVGWASAHRAHRSVGLKPTYGSGPAGKDEVQAEGHEHGTGEAVDPVRQPQIAAAHRWQREAR